MRKIFSTSLFFLVCGFTFAQALDTLWTRTYGGDIADYGRCVQLTSDNGYIIAGMTMSFGDGHRALVIKTDENGDTLWTRTFGGGNIDEASSLEQTVDGGYIIVGSTNTIGVGNFDILLIKIDEYGEEIWTKTFGGILDDFGSSVKQTTDSGYVLIGSTESFASGMQDIWLIKTDVNGNVIWDKRFGWTDYAGGSDVQQTTDGGYIVSGFSPSIGGWWSDFWLIKTDANGDTLWTKTFGGTDLDFSSSVQQTIDGGYIITGRTESFGAGGNDVWLIKTDESGDSLWTRIFGGLNGDGGKSVKQTLSGDFIIAGYTWSFGNGIADVWLLKVDYNGNEIWNKTFGLSGQDYGNSIQLTQDGGYIITGYIEISGKTKVWLLKTEPDIVGVESGPNEMPTEFLLSQNYPNPFNPSTKISWQVPVGSWQTLKIYDVLGNEVATLVDEYKPAGKYEVEYDASSLTSGVYFYQLQAVDPESSSHNGQAGRAYIETKKMILLK